MFQKHEKYLNLLLKCFHPSVSCHDWYYKFNLLSCLYVVAAESKEIHLWVVLVCVQNLPALYDLLVPIYSPMNSECFFFLLLILLSAKQKSNQKFNHLEKQ